MALSYICPYSVPDEEEISFDDRSGTWTVLPAWGMDKPLTGVPSKEMALAICLALYESYKDGCHAGSS